MHLFLFLKIGLFFKITHSFIPIPSRAVLSLSWSTSPLHTLTPPGDAPAVTPSLLSASFALTWKLFSHPLIDGTVRTSIFVEDAHYLFAIFL